MIDKETIWGGGGKVGITPEGCKSFYRWSQQPRTPLAPALLQMKAPGCLYEQTQPPLPSLCLLCLDRFLLSKVELYGEASRLCAVRGKNHGKLRL